MVFGFRSASSNMALLLRSRVEVMRLRSGFSAIDPKNLPGDEGRLIGRQISDRLGDFFGFARTFERHAGNQARLPVGIAGEPVEQLGLNRSGGDGVHAYAERSAFERRCLGEPLDRVL